MRLVYYDNNNNEVKLTDKYRIVRLTGTAAISDGFRTVQSPLLPFLIFVDYKKKKKSTHK